MKECLYSLLLCFFSYSLYNGTPCWAAPQKKPNTLSPTTQYPPKQKPIVRALPKWVNVSPTEIQAVQTRIPHPSPNKIQPTYAQINPVDKRLPVPTQTPRSSASSNTRRPSSISPKPQFNRDQYLLFQRLTSLIISPCCFTQPVSLHAGNASEQVKKIIHSFLLAGQSEKEILDFFVKRYGERILSIPRDSGLFWIPIIVAIFILLISFIIIRNWTRRSFNHSDQSQPIEWYEFQPLPENSSEKTMTSRSSTTKEGEN